MVEVTGILKEDPIQIENASGWTLHIAPSESWNKRLVAEEKAPVDSIVIRTPYNCIDMKKGSYIYASCPPLNGRGKPYISAVSIKLLDVGPRTIATKEVYLERSEYITIENCTFATECPMKWEDLLVKEDVESKYCSKCEQSVHWCHTDEELQTAILQNYCVALKKEHIVTLGRPASGGYRDEGAEPRPDYLDNPSF